MNARPAITISALERDIGIGKDTLRVWERRYGFPLPIRDSKGERLYPAAQVDRLRLICRLLDQGFRPGRLLASSEAELAELSQRPAPASAAPQPDDGLVRQVLGLIKAQDVAALRQALEQAMMRQGLQGFVLDTLVPLNQAVGEAWMRGEFEVFEEHLYTEQLQSLLRRAIGNLAQSTGHPRILLTTVPEEQHILGLLMAEALLVLDGANCLSLGTQTPLRDIRMAAQVQSADIVALSFSSAFPARQIAPQISQLRALLPETTELWVGGAGAERLSTQPGLVRLSRLQDALVALDDWRSRQRGVASSGEMGVAKTSNQESALESPSTAIRSKPPPLRARG
jgi:DNA-binding transcriptional MerR regulator